MFDVLDALTCLTNNGTAVRKVLAVALAFAVQAAGLTAPLVHAHPDDHATEHHGGRALHTHWTGHAAPHSTPDTPALDTADHDRAVFLTAFVAATPSPLAVHGLVHSVFALAVPAERQAHRGIEVTRSHDPPPLGPCQSRAPPTDLS